MNKIQKEFEEIKNYYLLLFKNAFRFGGRATRKEYWYGIISHYIIFAFISLILTPIFESTTNTFAQFCGGIILLTYFLPAIIGLLSIYYRRMRDVGKSSWFSFLFQILSAIPLLGIPFFIGTFAFLCQPSLIKNSDN